MPSTDIYLWTLITFKAFHLTQIQMATAETWWNGIMGRVWHVLAVTFCTHTLGHKHRSTKCQLFANRKLSNAQNFKRHTFMLMRFKSFLITFAGVPNHPPKKQRQHPDPFGPPIRKTHPHSRHSEYILRFMIVFGWENV